MTTTSADDENPTTVITQSPAQKTANDWMEQVACPVCQNSERFIEVAGSRVDRWIGALNIGLTRSLWSICQQCGLVMQNPRPGPEAYKRLYEGKVYHSDQVSPEQIQQSIAMVEYCFQEKIEYCERFFPNHLSKPWRVLDIGCGMGESLFAFRKRGYEVHGVQPDPTLVELARQHFGLKLREGYFSASTFRDNDFSIVFTNHAFEHFDDPLDVADGIARALRPGGICFTCVPTYARNKTMNAKHWMNSAHNWLFTHHTLAALFGRVGLKYVSHTYSGTPKYTDELWLVVEKPVESLPAAPRKDVTADLPSWKYVRNTLQMTVPMRSFLFLPTITLQKAKKLIKLTQGNPRKIVSYFRQVVKSNSHVLKLWIRSHR